MAGLAKLVELVNQYAAVMYAPTAKGTSPGLRLADKLGSGEMDGFINLLVEVRTEVRKQKLWALSDLIRDRLKTLGVTIEDGKEGTKWRWG